MTNLKNFNPAKYSGQKETFRVERIIQLSKEVIWNELVQYENMVDWMPGITAVKIKHNQEGNQGVGCKRECTFGSEKLKEEIVLFEEENAYGYKIHDNNLIEDHVAYITLQGLSHHKTKITWVQHFKPKGNFIKKFALKNFFFPRTIKKGLQNLDKKLAA